MHTPGLSDGHREPAVPPGKLFWYHLNEVLDTWNWDFFNFPKLSLNFYSFIKLELLSEAEDRIKKHWWPSAQPPQHQTHSQGRAVGGWFWPFFSSSLPSCWGQSFPGVQLHSVCSQLWNPWAAQARTSPKQHLDKRLLLGFLPPDKGGAHSTATFPLDEPGCTSAENINIHIACRLHPQASPGSHSDHWILQNPMKTVLICQKKILFLSKRCRKSSWRWFIHLGVTEGNTYTQL